MPLDFNDFVFQFSFCSFIEVWYTFVQEIRQALTGIVTMPLDFNDFVFQFSFCSFIEVWYTFVQEIRQALTGILLFYVL